MGASVNNKTKRKFVFKAHKPHVLRGLACAALAGVGALILVNPQRYVAVCFDGLCLWAECVLPSLFPFMVIALLLISLGAAEAASSPFKRICRALGLPACAPPLFLMGALCGYPAGSRMVYEYYARGAVDRAGAEKLAPMCSACGPLFAVGTVGVKAFKSGGAGAVLYAACLISVAGSSLIFCLIKRNSGSAGCGIGAGARANVGECFTSAVSACLAAGAYICFFYTLSVAARDLHLFAPLVFLLAPALGEQAAEGLGAGFIEPTGGCFALAAAGGFFALPLAGFTMTFGGLSIIFQQLGYLEGCGVKPAFFALFKLLQGALCFALLCLLQLVYPAIYAW